MRHLLLVSHFQLQQLFLNVDPDLSSLMGISVHVASSQHFAFWGDELLIRKWAEHSINNSCINILKLPIILLASGHSNLSKYSLGEIP
jgi:hypothetical protein